jgi:hypothetical protein
VNKILKYAMMLAVTALAVVILGVVAYVNRPPTLVEKIAVKEAQHALIVTTMASGCTAAGVKDQQMGQALAMTRGMVCLQILEETLPNELQGKGFCKPDDKKCLFAVAYTVTSIRGLGRDDLDQIESEIDESYEKVYATKEKQ